MLRWLLCLCLSLLACAGPSRLAPPQGFAAPLGQRHPLAGRVWSRAERQLVSKEALLASVSAARVVLLGETHDNVDHHRLQALLLERWLGGHPPRAPAVAFEMLDESQAPALAQSASDPDQLAQAVGWEASGWPPFDLYRPVFVVALRTGTPVIAAHPSRERVRASMHGSSPEELRALQLEPPLPAAAQAALAREIEQSHCGHAPAEMVEAMVRAQNFKDGWMARVVADAGRPVALIAGRGHIDSTRGVPLFLARRGVEQVLSVALLEVVEGRERPEDYDISGFDLTLFTPRMSDEDPCAQFRAQLERMRAGPKPNP